MHTDEVDLWPENVAVFNLFLALETNWRPAIGASGVIWQAPDHSNALAAMQMLGVKKRQRGELFNALCGMEQAALAVLNA